MPKPSQVEQQDSETEANHLWISQRNETEVFLSGQAKVRT